MSYSNLVGEAEEDGSLSQAVERLQHQNVPHDAAHTQTDEHDGYYGQGSRPLGTECQPTFMGTLPRQRYIGNVPTCQKNQVEDAQAELAHQMLELEDIEQQECCTDEQNDEECPWVERMLPVGKRNPEVVEPASRPSFSIHEATDVHAHT